jgi:predicted RNase H-like nuclease (RuvC/YqgF family)
LSNVPFFISRVRINTQQQLTRSNDSLQSNEAEQAQLRAKVEGLENKGARLREYIRKLTAKCEEWEVSYEKQSKRIERHDEQHRETRRKASEIARRYQKLASEMGKRKTVRTMEIFYGLVVELPVPVRFNGIALISHSFLYLLWAPGSFARSSQVDGRAIQYAQCA